MSIPRSSLSDVNLFLAEPAAWIIKHFLGYRSGVGARAHGGRAVEHGLDRILLNKLGVDEGAKAAVEFFNKETGGEITDAMDDERAAIPLMVNQAATAFGTFAFKTLVSTQSRVMVEIEGVNVLGYVDYLYEGFVVDLKTKRACPAKPEKAHIRQLAFYERAIQSRPVLCYVTAKRAAIMEVGPHEADEGMAHVCAALRAIGTLKRNAENWRRYAELFPPREIGSFYFDAHSRKLAKDLWKLGGDDGR